MSKKNILNLALFIVVISLAFFIYDSEEKNYQLERLTEIYSGDIKSITIKHNKNTTTIIKQGAADWEITTPVSIAANIFRINSILDLINAPIHNRYSLSEINPESLGLSNPTTQIRFDDSIISFGITNPATGLRYVQLNDFIYTIEDIYFPLISSHFGTLVSLNLLPVDSTVKKLILGNQTITKNSLGFWQSNIEISSDNIIKVIEDWKSTQAFGIHEYLQRDNLGEVFVYLVGQKKPVAYTITDTDPWLILVRSELGLEYHVDVEAYNNLISPQ